MISGADQTDGPPILLRRAEPDDATAMGDIFLAAFRATYDFPLAHTDEQVRAWVRDELLATRETWLAVAPDGDDEGSGGIVVGLMSLSDDELDQLYLRPGWWRRGIGSRLVALAKERRPRGLALHTFQVNGAARAFYERHGFRAAWFGDGSANEERQPDVRYEWRP